MLSDTFIGQETAVTQLQTAIDVSKTRGTILPHVLLLAAPGVGKTRLASDIAWELDAPFYEFTMPGPTDELLGLMMVWTGVLLIDEIHQADRKVMDMLLPFLTSGKLRHNRVTVSNERLTIIGATTDPQKIPDAFRSRFRLVPPFDDYSDEEITDIILASAEQKLAKVPRDIATGLASASLWNPRQAIQLLDTYIDLSVLHDEVDTVDVLRHLGFTRKGLRPDHLRYLRALRSQGGVASQSTLAQMVSMPASSLYWVEKDLLRLGLLAISSAGRQLRSQDWEDDVVSGDEPEDQSPQPDLNPYTLEPR